MDKVNIAELLARIERLQSERDAYKANSSVWQDNAASWHGEALVLRGKNERLRAELRDGRFQLAYLEKTRERERVLVDALMQARATAELYAARLQSARREITGNDRARDRMPWEDGDA